VSSLEYRREDLRRREGRREVRCSILKVKSDKGGEERSQD